MREFHVLHPTTRRLRFQVFDVTDDAAALPFKLNVHALWYEMRVIVFDDGSNSRLAVRPCRDPGNGQ